ncbi:sulfotransferase family protein [Phenylobacterium sp.]|uniref:sulfotransferase family protein n=1 Tax=Phenylobacterium sp. TaxID=1871053 RepID=UPI0025D7CAFB|nr:sulfotransferase family protein [Phenylobacterium sp.]
MALQVIGSGLGRTGTLSSKLALEQLGFGPCHHMVEVFMHPQTLPLWVAAGAGQGDWDAMFAGYRSMVDHPGCMYWRELAAHYPDAKVLHTVRDPGKWFDSTQATIFAPRPADAPEMPPPMKAFLDTVANWYGGDRNDRAFMLDFFARHTEAVIAGVPKDRLLVFDVAQGWEPLCAFMDVPVPDTPFPRENSTQQFQASMAGGGPGKLLEAARASHETR